MLFNEKLEQHEEKLLSFKNIKSSNSTLQNFKHQYSTFKKISQYYYKKRNK